MRVMFRSWLALGWLAVALACGTASPPPAPSAVSAVAATPLGSAIPAVVVPPRPLTLALTMPIDAADAANTTFGLAPFGYHGPDQPSSGSPGWDIEYRIGAQVRAGAEGQVAAVLADPATPGRTRVEIAHTPDSGYRTIYGNLASVAPDIAVGEVVRRGQPLGTAGTMTSATGAAYAMARFQLDDYEGYYPIPNPNAVSPLPYLTGEATVAFARIWTTAASAQELTEPFSANPRLEPFPMSRTWKRESGTGPWGITFTRRSARTNDYEYAVLAESGTAIEAGTVTLRYTQRPQPTIDLVTPTGNRLGVYDIVDATMRLAISPPGGIRPTGLSDASVYRTVLPTRVP